MISVTSLARDYLYTKIVLCPKSRFSTLALLDNGDPDLAASPPACRIDDALMDSFVVVRPTGTPMNETVGNRAKSEQDRAIPKWTGLFHEAPVKDNIAITDADIPATNAPAMIYPNPVNPKKLIVINRSNSWQVVQFPDYGVVDITSPATQAGRGEIARHRPSSARGG